MKRDPSIHVRRSSLSEALSEIIQGDVEPIVDELFLKLTKEAIRNRVLIKATAQTKKKMARVASVDKDLAETFNAAYTMFNSVNNIRAAIIKPNDSKYTVLKEVAQQAQEFCTMFELEQSTGFEIYLRTAHRLAKNKYSIYYLKGMADRIIQDRENMLTLENDEDREGTTTFYATWKQVSVDYLGGSTSIESPELYVHFVFGRQDADEMGADYYDWIAAQFEGIKEYGSVPELAQLHGDNAKLRYTKFTGKKHQKYARSFKK
jgi:hypothetical protein